MGVPRCTPRLITSNTAVDWEPASLPPLTKPRPRLTNPKRLLRERQGRGQVLDRL